MRYSNNDMSTLPLCGKSQLERKRRAKDGGRILPEMGTPQKKRSVVDTQGSGSESVVGEMIIDQILGFGI